MKSIVFVVTFLAATVMFGNPVGNVQFTAKVISYDKNWVHLNVSGKKAKIPRKLINDKKIVVGHDRDFHIPVAEFSAMRNRFYAKKKK